MDGFAIFLLVVAIVGVAWYLRAARKRAARRLEEASRTATASGLSTVRSLFDTESNHRAPVSEFHVRGDQAIVVFEVPLPDESDPVLDELLMSEAIEVVREKRHTLPIDDVTEIVVSAGRDQVREVGRTKLTSPGELPPAMDDARLSFAYIAHDPFAAPFADEVDHSIHYEVKSDAPPDELGPLSDELKLPQGLDRGLRALGVDPETADGADLILSLLRMFGYAVTEQAYPGSYMAMKDGVSTYILTESHRRGESPEVSESVIRRFLADFDSSGAERGMLLSGKYAPFLIHEIESRQPKVRFITRERVQRFIDSMALG